MTWQILDQVQTKNVVEQVRSAGLGELFSSPASEGRVMRLPFYRNGQIYRLTNYATLPAFSLYYLGNGDNYMYLDGGVQPIDAYNKNDNLILNEQTVLPYLDFFLTFVTLDVGEIRMTGDRDLDGLLKEYPEKATVRHDSARNIYSVETPLYYDGSLMKGTIEITSNGIVQIVNTEMHMHGVEESLETHSSDTYI